MDKTLKLIPETEEFKRIKELCYKARDEWFSDTLYRLEPYWEGPGDIIDYERILLAMVNPITWEVITDHIDPLILNSENVGHMFRMMFIGMEKEKKLSFSAGRAAAIASITTKLCEIVDVGAVIEVKKA
jgi:hypothetical protein